MNAKPEEARRDELLLKLLKTPPQPRSKRDRGEPKPEPDRQVTNDGSDKP